MNDSPTSLTGILSFGAWRSTFSGPIIPFRVATRFSLFLLATAMMTIGLGTITCLKTLRILQTVAFRHYTSLIIRFTCQVLCRVCRIKIENPHSLLDLLQRHHRSLVICNHVSYLDVVLMGALVPGRFLSKKEVASWPLIGWCGKWTDMIFVDRFDMNDRVRALLKLKEACGTQHAIVFPEGTTTPNVTPDYSRWQRGNVWAAHRNGIPLIAVGIHYHLQEQIAWIDDQTFLPHLLKVFSLPDISVKISTDVVKSENQKLNEQSRSAFDSVVGACLAAAISSR